MSHELDITGGVASFADSRQAADGRVDAWHKLGQSIGRAMTAEEALRLANLADWNVRKQPAWTTDDKTGLVIPMVGRNATVRTNPVSGETEYLGDVGDRYEIIQNESLVEFMDALVDQSGAHFETAGSIRNGREVFVTMEVPDYMEFRGSNGEVDRTALNIAIMNSHDGFGSLSVRLTPVRIVCRNTQQAAIANTKSIWTRRHTLNALNAVEQAREALSLNFAYADAFQAEMDKLIQREMDEKEAERLVNEIFQVNDSTITTKVRDNRVDHANQTLLGLSLKTVIGFENTRYGLYNALTEYVDHRIETRTGAGAPAETMLLGSDYSLLKERGFRVLSAK